MVTLLIVIHARYCLTHFGIKILCMHVVLPKAIVKSSLKKHLPVYQVNERPLWQKSERNTRSLVVCLLVFVEGSWWQEMSSICLGEVGGVPIVISYLQKIVMSEKGDFMYKGGPTGEALRKLNETLQHIPSNLCPKAAVELVKSYTCGGPPFATIVVEAPPL